MENFIQKLEGSLYKGFINQKHNHPGIYKPKLLVNNTKKNENVLSSLLEELENSTAFIFRWLLLRKVG